MRYKSSVYLEWVRMQPCSVTRRSPGSYENYAHHAHHIIGHGQGGSHNSKASDLFAFSLCAQLHTGAMGVHGGVKTWEKRYGNQWQHVARQLKRAIEENIVTAKTVKTEIESEVINEDDKAFLINEIGL